MHRDTQSCTDSRFTSQSCGEKNTQENTKVCSHEKKKCIQMQYLARFLNVWLIVLIIFKEVVRCPKNLSPMSSNQTS